jgi:hypothetical protein
VVLDVVPEVNESAVDARVQFDHAREPSDDQLVGPHTVRRGQADACVKRYWTVELNAVRPGDRQSCVGRSEQRTALPFRNEERPKQDASLSGIVRAELVRFLLVHLKQVGERRCFAEMTPCRVRISQVYIAPVVEPRCQNSFVRGVLMIVLASPEAAGLFQQKMTCAAQLRWPGRARWRRCVCVYHSTGAECEDCAACSGRPAHCPSGLVNISPLQNGPQGVHVGEEEVDALPQKRWFQQVRHVMSKRCPVATQLLERLETQRHIPLLVAQLTQHLRSGPFRPLLLRYAVACAREARRRAAPTSAGFSVHAPDLSSVTAVG